MFFFFFLVKKYSILARLDLPLFSQKNIKNNNSNLTQFYLFIFRHMKTGNAYSGPLIAVDFVVLKTRLERKKSVSTRF